MQKCFLSMFKTIIIFTLTINISQFAFAQGKVNVQDGPIPEAQWMVKVTGDELNEDHSGVKTWITKWYGPDGNYENNDPLGKRAPRDFISEGTGEKLTQLTLSTIEGLYKTRNVKMEWPRTNGGTRGWTVFEIDPTNPNNMQKEGGAVNSFDTYAICVIDAPKAMKSVMSPAHDDHAQIWINGEKWYNNPTWTGGVQQVDFNIEVELKKGANVLLYRCSEGGGSAYLNLHFDDATHDAVRIYPDKATDQATFFKEIDGVLPVEPRQKLATTWADIKQR